MNDIAARSNGDGRYRRWLWLLVMGVLVLRVLYLGLANPYELAGDEAHYWEWSRRPALSYYSKGPGVAMAIWASTNVFGSTEFGVRLPAALSAAISMLALAELTRRISGSRRAGLFAAALFALTPAYTAMAQFMTIDSPYLACWAVSALLGWIVYERQRDGRTAWPWWIALGLMMGITFLFKYLVLMLMPGLAAFWLLRCRSMRWRGRTWLNVLLWFIAGTVAVSPVILWNYFNDWPTLKHTMGHMQVEGGDVAPEHESYSPLWMLEMVGSQIGIIGPPIIVLIVMAVRHFWRRRLEDAARWTGALYLLCCAAPILLFFFLFTLRGQIEINWPIAGFVTLLVIPAMALPGWLDDFRRRVAEWQAIEDRPRPKRGFTRRKPETLAQVAWHWSIGVGVVAAIGIAFVPYVNAIPGVEVPGLNRVAGHEARAKQVHEVIESVEAATGEKPWIVCDYYMKAGLVAFYLPDQPVVYCAASLTGKRANTYDFLDDTDLTDPPLIGRDAVLVDSYMKVWNAALDFEAIEAADDAEEIYIGRDYRGVKEP